MPARRLQRQPARKSIRAAKATRRPAQELPLSAHEARWHLDATLRRFCEVVHQVGVVGGADYDSKERRLEQLLERIPSDSGPVVVFVQPASAAAVTAAIQRCCSADDAAESSGPEPPPKRMRQKVATPCRRGASSDSLKEGRARPSVAVVAVGLGACASPADDAALEKGHGSYQYVINYDMPSTSSEYVGRLAALGTGLAADPLRVAYTFVDVRQQKGRGGLQLAGLLRRARAAAASDQRLGGEAKAAELGSALEQLCPPEEEEEEEEEQGTGNDDDDECDCPHCRGCAVGGTSYHAMSSLPGGMVSGVEVVRIPLRALEDLAAAGPLIAPRLPGHVCSMICLHCLYAHTSWDGYEHLFMPPELKGTMRVVLVLADGCSWHHYWNGKKGEYCSRACKEHRSSSRPRPTPPKTAVQCAMPDCVRPAMGGEFCSRACAAKATCSAQVTTGSPTEFAKIGDGEGSSSLQEPDFVSSAASTADSPDATRSGRRRGARHPVCQLEAEEDTGRLQVFTQMMGARLQVIAFSYEGSKQACDKVCQSEFLGNRYDMEHSIISVKAANEQDTTWRHFKSAEVAFLALKHWQRAGKLESLTSEEAFRKQETGLGPEDPTYAGYGSAWAAMLGVLRQKFRRGSELAQRLLSTNEAFLLCRCSDIGIDQVWSDNACGDGENWLGMQLMLVRDELRKREGRWSHVIRLGLDVETGLAHSQLAAKTWRQATTAASGALQYAEVKLMVAD